MVSSVGFSQAQYSVAPQGMFNGNMCASATPEYTTSLNGDTVELSSKKKSGSKVKKGIIGTLVGLAAATTLLYAGVKSGKLTKIDNASKWTEKLQNLAFEGGSYVKKGVEYVATKIPKSTKQFTDEQTETLREFADALREDMQKRGLL